MQSAFLRSILSFDPMSKGATTSSVYLDNGSLSFFQTSWEGNSNNEHNGALVATGSSYAFLRDRDFIKNEAA